ncbi:MAG: hypothetical protein CMK09_03525 [Ponticaulis sp.]|nr:hypothetical protein [Ponticaulis sp.]|tara:strand:+ start:19257 stop:19643 length:387 start_codon:yes stop_codon:yes gene_type:complete
MKIKFGAVLVLGALTVAGCSTGELRAFNDALAMQNGYNVTYRDQSDTKWIGDIKWTSAVQSGSYYTTAYNDGNEYCRVKIDFENDTSKTYNLDPGESTGRIYTSVYNQADYMNTLCGNSREAYNESFN